MGQINLTKNNPKHSISGKCREERFQCKQRSKVGIRAGLERVSIGKTRKRRTAGRTCAPVPLVIVEFSFAGLCRRRGLGFRTVAPRLSPSPVGRGAWTCTLPFPVSARKDALPARAAASWSS